MANWLFQENKASRKVSLSDDGTSKLALTFVATYANPLNWNPITSADTPPLAVKNSPTAMLKDLSNLFPIGASLNPLSFTGVVTNNTQVRPDQQITFDPNGSCSTSVLWWTVDSYSAAMPARSDRTVWNVQVNLSACGRPNCAMDYPFGYSLIRRDLEISTSVGLRSAPAFASWYQLDPNNHAPGGNVQYPEHGDSNQGSGTAANFTIPNSLVAVDINGSPISQSIPQNAITVNKIVPFTRTGSDPPVGSVQQWLKALRNNVGFRNSDSELGYRRGQLLFAGVDMVQLGRSGVRLTFRFMADDFYHLTQEQILATTSNNLTPSGAFTTVTYPASGGGAGLTLTTRHAAAMWRQPYALTTESNSWTLTGTSSPPVGHLGFSAEDASYLNQLTGSP